MRGRHRSRHRSVTWARVGRTLANAVRRRRGLLLVVLAAVVGAALLGAVLSPRRYLATAEVVLVGGDFTTERAAIRSPAMAARVLAALLHDRSIPSATFGVSERRLGMSLCTRRLLPVDEGGLVGCLMRQVTVSQPTDTLTLRIGFEAADVPTAVQVANGFARAYVAGLPGRSDGGIVARADASALPVGRHLPGRLALSLVLGLVLGTAATVVAEWRFAGLTDGADIRDRLWLDHLGNVPLLASVLPGVASIVDAVVDHPRSTLAEAFRNLLAALDRLGGERPRTMAICSTVAGEGGTTVAICLARSLALAGASVVLVDCTGRRGLDALLGQSAATGLGEIAEGGAALDDALLRDGASGAAILSLASQASEAHAAPPGPAVATVLAELRARFDHVLILAGPLTAGPRARHVAALADLALLVVRWRGTAARAVVASIEQLRASRVRIAGAVLNRVDMHKQVHYSSDEETAYQRMFSEYYS